MLASRALERGEAGGALASVASIARRLAGEGATIPTGGAPLGRDEDERPPSLSAVGANGDQFTAATGGGGGGDGIPISRALPPAIAPLPPPASNGIAPDARGELLECSAAVGTKPVVESAAAWRIKCALSAPVPSC